MKRILTLLAAALLLTAALCGTASASEFDKTAEELSAIGMFRGSDKGFELDRAPTRSEAAIMLVRLYGAEEDAKTAYAAGALTHPFTDVSDFAAPYVAWVYENGISKGTGATAFGSANPCSAKMYCAFLLRALGYRDGADFTYDDTLSFAQSKGFYVPAAFGGEFLRGDLAAVTYQALATELKDGGTYLLASLIQSGAVDAKAAAPITEKIETYRTLNSTVGEAMGGSLDADMDIKMNMDVVTNGTLDGQSVAEKQTTATAGTGSIQLILDEDDLRFGYTMKMTTKSQDGDETTEMGMWMKDGRLYVRSGETAYQYPAEKMAALYQQVLDQYAQLGEVSMLPYIDGISVHKSGSDTVYTLHLGGAMNSLFDSFRSLLGAELLSGLGLEMSMDMKECTYTYTVGANGRLKTVSAAMKMSVSMNMNAGDERVVSTSDYDMALTMKVGATGDAVKVSYPDLSKFQESAGPLGTLPAIPAA